MTEKKTSAVTFDTSLKTQSQADSKRSTGSNIRSVHIDEKGNRHTESFDFISERNQISFRSVPYLLAPKYTTLGSAVDVTTPHIQLSLIQASRLPTAVSNSLTIYLWHGYKDVPVQRISCNLLLESLSEDGKESTDVFAATGILDISAKMAVITDIKVEKGKYTDIALPLRITGNILIK